MNSPDDFANGAPVGSGESAAPAVRRTSNAFGSPGTDSTVRRIDLNEQLIRHPDATYTMRAVGDAMAGAGIADGDVLLVDRALTPQHGAVVIAVVDGELLCRRLEQARDARGRATGSRLVADGGAAADVALTAEKPLEAWGVVTHVIKSLA